MTYEEAKEIIENMCTTWSRDVDEALIIAIDAIEKQIPKKPKKVLCADNKTYAHHCPSCGAWITRTITLENKFDAEKVNANGCYACLQAIDWSEEE